MIILFVFLLIKGFVMEADSEMRNIPFFVGLGLGGSALIAAGILLEEVERKGKQILFQQFAFVKGTYGWRRVITVTCLCCLISFLIGVLAPLLLGGLLKNRTETVNSEPENVVRIGPGGGTTPGGFVSSGLILFGSVFILWSPFLVVWFLGSVYVPQMKLPGSIEEIIHYPVTTAMIMCSYASALAGVFFFMLWA